MPENYTPAAAATGTWTEEEIRHQPRAWIRSLTNIDALRSALNNFLEPLLRKENLQIILTGAGTSAFIGDIIAPWLASHTGKNFSAVPTTDLVTNPMDYLNPAHPLLLISFGRSGNSPESVAAVELAKHNAALAGVDDCITFAVADAREFDRTTDRGVIVTNPPYGERLMEKREAEALYTAFGAAYAKTEHWRLYLLSSHTEFERAFGRPADKKRKLYNGTLRCDLFQYTKDV